MGPLARSIELLFSFRGRVARATYWLATLLLLASFWVLAVFLESVAGRAATLALYVPLYLGLAALAVKRFHDCARSPWWLLAALIPVLGALWVFFELGFRKGTSGSNQYGEDPLERGRDYLTVS